MTITHHPLDETLMAYAAGALDVGRSLVVEAHIRSCVRCQRSNALLERTAGAMLEDLGSVPMSDGALAAALSLLDTPTGSPASIKASTLLADILAAPDRGPWKWLGPGVHMRPIVAPEGAGARVFLLKAAPGLGLPQHTHTGTELTLVLSGAFAHAGGRFGQGDCDDADDTDEHNPVVEPGEPCICLVAMDGHLKLQGLLGRIMQPFVRL